MICSAINNGPTTYQYNHATSGALISIALFTPNAWIINRPKTMYPMSPIGRQYHFFIVGANRPVIINSTTTYTDNVWCNNPVMVRE